MKSPATGTISGCIVWVIVFGAPSLCILPVASTMGGLTSDSEVAMKTMGP